MRWLVLSKKHQTTAKTTKLSKVTDTIGQLFRVHIPTDWLIDWCFTPTLAMFQLYRGVN
jgi:hypothetical protein